MTNDPFMILILILSQQDNLQPMITSSFLTNIYLLVSFSVYDFWLTHEIKVKLSLKRGYWLKFLVRTLSFPEAILFAFSMCLSIPLLSHDKLLLRPSMKLQLYRKRWKF